MRNGGDASPRFLFLVLIEPSVNKKSATKYK